MRESFLCVTVPPKALRKPKPCWKAIHDWSNNPVFLHTFTGSCETRPILTVIIIKNVNCYNVAVVVVVVVGGGGGGEESISSSSSDGSTK